MPKFQSVVIKEEKLDSNGKIKQIGEIALIPLDDAAMLEPCCEKALMLGLIKNEKGEAFTPEAFEKKREEIRKNFKKLQVEDMKKRQPLS